MNAVCSLKRLVPALLVLGLIISLPIISFAKADPKQEEITYRYLETFANVLSILQENYVEEIEAREAIEGAINGLLLSLDPHSAYLKPDNYREFRNETNGSFTGIGIRITLEDGVISEDLLKEEMAQGHLRSDAMALVEAA